VKSKRERMHKISKKKKIIWILMVYVESVIKTRTLTYATICDWLFTNVVPRLNPHSVGYFLVLVVMLVLNCIAGPCSILVKKIKECYIYNVNLSEHFFYDMNPTFVLNNLIASLTYIKIASLNESDKRKKIPTKS
jgi:hypothetical protein